ncbi:hypothetical protein D3C81_2049780 [compost metagenome]
MGAGGFQSGIIHDDAVGLLLQDPLIGGLQEVVFPADNGILAVENAEQLNCAAPGVIVAAVNLG